MPQFNTPNNALLGQPKYRSNLFAAMTDDPLASLPLPARIAQSLAGSNSGVEPVASKGLNILQMLGMGSPLGQALRIGLPVAQQFLQQRANNEAIRQQSMNQNRANFLNMLNPRANVQAPQAMPKSNALMRIVGGAQQALSAIDQMQKYQDDSAAQDLQREYIQSGIDVNNARAQNLRQPPAPKTQGSSDPLSTLGPIVEKAARSQMPWQDVVSLPQVQQAGADAVPSLQIVYENAAKDTLEKQNKAASDFLYGDLKSKFSSNELLKKSGDLMFGMNLMANGYKQQNGTGDLMMVNAMVRLSDPGVSVRPMEAQQMEEVGGLLEKYQIIASGEQFLEGTRFTDKVRNKLLTAAENLYAGQEAIINQQLQKEIKAALPQYERLGGTPEAMNLFASTYFLPTLSDYRIQRREDSPVNSDSVTVEDIDAEIARRPSGR